MLVIIMIGMRGKTNFEVSCRQCPLGYVLVKIWLRKTCSIISIIPNRCLRLCVVWTRGKFSHLLTCQYQSKHTLSHANTSSIVFFDLLLNVENDHICHPTF
jgi:hypothetical protein